MEEIELGEGDKHTELNYARSGGNKITPQIAARSDESILAEELQLELSMSGVTSVPSRDIAPELWFVWSRQGLPLRNSGPPITTCIALPNHISEPCRTHQCPALVLI